MPQYPLDLCKVVEHTARVRAASALRPRAPRFRSPGSGFTAEQFLAVAAQYNRRAKQTPMVHERREYRDLARRFAEEAANAQARDEVAWDAEKKPSLPSAPIFFHGPDAP
jgi:hypothetical protein